MILDFSDVNAMAAEMEAKTVTLSPTSRAVIWGAVGWILPRPVWLQGNELPTDVEWDAIDAALALLSKELQTAVSGGGVSVSDGAVFADCLYSYPSGRWTRVLNSTYMYGYCYYFVPAENGDNVWAFVSFISGFHELVVLGHTSSARGITQLYLDDVAIDGTVMDWYSAPAVSNVQKDAVFWVDVTGYKKFELRVIGKNLASSGYNLAMTKASWRG